MLKVIQRSGVWSQLWSVGPEACELTPSLLAFGICPAVNGKSQALLPVPDDFPMSISKAALSTTRDGEVPQEPPTSAHQYD